jgi:hypothetical protein
VSGGTGAGRCGRGPSPLSSLRHHGQLVRAVDKQYPRERMAFSLHKTGHVSSLSRQAEDRTGKLKYFYNGCRCVCAVLWASCVWCVVSRRAADRGSRDDISIVCVRLNAADWPPPPPSPAAPGAAAARARSAGERGHTPQQHQEVDEEARQQLVGAPPSAAKPPLAGGGSGSLRSGGGGGGGGTPASFPPASPMPMEISPGVAPPPPLAGADTPGVKSFLSIRSQSIL